MPKAKPPVHRLCDLTPGQVADVFVLLAERTKKATREGKSFFACRFRDAKRAAAFMVWADGGWYEECEQVWRENQFYKLRGRYTEHDKYGPQFVEVEAIRAIVDADKADGFNPADFVAGTRFDPAAMLAELTQIIEKEIGDEPLRKLVLTLVERYAEPLTRLPATQGRFYPFAGGLLEHILSVTRNCLFLAGRYAEHYPDLKPQLNRDLVIAGAVLHDIGRVLEYDGEPGFTQPTIPGRLFGHLFLGRDLVRDAAREQGDLNPELVRLLEHLIISHLNHPEWGSPPCTSLINPGSIAA